jgi:hypothetical protein
LERGVDVIPVDKEEIEINGKNVYVSATIKEFTIRDKKDMNNEPTCISRGKKRDNAAFYAWAKKNQSRIENMTFSQVVSEIREAGIDYHQYCAMD